MNCLVCGKQLKNPDAAMAPLTSGGVVRLCSNTCRRLFDVMDAEQQYALAFGSIEVARTLAEKINNGTYKRESRGPLSYLLPWRAIASLFP